MINSVITQDELDSIYRCISLAMDYRDAVDEGLVKEDCEIDWLSLQIDKALVATYKVSGIWDLIQRR